MGAGIAGLSAARTLVSAGLRPRLLDKGRRPGGRCASRHFGQGLVDFGPVFGHTADSELFDLAQSAGGAGFLPSWPTTVGGLGEPCQRDSLSGQQRRFAFAGGMNLLPALLAKDLDVACETQVTALRDHGERWIVETTSAAFETDVLLLCLPPAQSQALLSPLRTGPVPSFVALLDLVTLVPCLTLSVELDTNVPLPTPLTHPQSLVVQLLSDESSKRPSGDSRLLTIQARAGWSAANLEVDPAVWSKALIEAAMPHCPALAMGVRSTRPHRWRWSRLAGPGLDRPVVGCTASGARFGLAGDAFDRLGGIEGAWRAGRALARRFLEVTST